MSYFFIHTKLKKALPNSSESLRQQLNILDLFIKDLSKINPLLETWYVNNATDETPPLNLPFPSERADKYLFKDRHIDRSQIYNLWNGNLDNDFYVSVSLGLPGFRLHIDKGFETEQIAQIFATALKYITVSYMCMSNGFLNDSKVFEHRLPVSPICYVSGIVENDEIPFLYKSISVSNELNTGTILIFDENIFDESDEMKKKIQENAVALVDLDLLPETELDDDYFSDYKM